MSNNENNNDNVDAAAAAAAAPNTTAAEEESTSNNNESPTIKPVVTGSISREQLQKGISLSIETAKETIKQRESKTPKPPVRPSPGNFTRADLDQTAKDNSYSAIYSLVSDNPRSELNKGRFFAAASSSEHQAATTPSGTVTKGEDSTSIKYFFGPPAVREETLKEIERQLQEPKGFNGLNDLIMNYQVTCPFCRRAVGWNRAQAKTHIFEHNEMKEHVDNIRESTKLWYDNAALLYQLEYVQLAGIQEKIKSVKQTLSMLETAEDCQDNIHSIRLDLFLKALNENVLPRDIRYSDISLGDKPRTQAEQDWFNQYLEDNPELKTSGISFDKALRDFSLKRKTNQLNIQQQ
jgi:hypothetical protein